MDSEEQEVSGLVEELESLKSEAEGYRIGESIEDTFMLTDVRIRYFRDYKKRLEVFRPYYPDVDELMSYFEGGD